MRITLLGAWALALLLPPALVPAVKPEDFKACAQSSFCRRLRGISRRYNEAPTTFASPYSLGAPSTPSPGTWAWAVRSSLYPEIAFELRVDILDGAGARDVVRVRMDEVGSKTAWKRYDEAARWALVSEPEIARDGWKVKTERGVTRITHGERGELELRVEHSPLKITQSRGGQEMVVLNDRSLLHMEHFRVKEEDKSQDQVEGQGGGEQQVVMASEKASRRWFEESDDDAFSERWKQWTDSKPKGPEALSIDITFPGVEHIYGLPEHASPLSLPDTTGRRQHYTDPYRLFNVDIFEYLADSPMALYGAIPLLHAHSASHSVGVLNLVASDTYVDVEHKANDGGVATHWMSESGILDLFLLPGPRPDALFKQHAALTGPTPLPPQWSTAYHQCRWNYIDEADVLAVQRGFDEVDIPLDVTWLDIEYAEEHRYFDWDRKLFPDPAAMQNEVASKGRKMVAIVDPHIKKSDNRIYNDAKDLDVLMKKPDGSNFEGWCWTGSSVWVDFFNPTSWDWWTRMFSFDVWKESTPSLFIWNDMNEPSVFDGPEISVPRDTVHHGGWENRDVHNINGMLFHNQTSAALIARQSPPQRPFVLSRSFYAGSQRFGAIWTGDNLGTWDHFAGETAMILSNNIGGMSFCGADVGGFFGNPSTELLVRWYQAGAFMPFFRAHAHIDTKRREPYLYDEPVRGYIRDAVRMRYTLLPVWYNAFHDASVWGYPIVRPQYTVFPDDVAGFGIDDQYYIGDSGLLFKPVTTEGAETTTVYLSEPHFDYFTNELHPAGNVTLATPLGAYPLLQRGGSIVPSRPRVRRASPLMARDPLALRVASDARGEARGQVYLDDGVGYGYERGEYVWRELRLEAGRLRSRVHPRAHPRVEGDVTGWEGAEGIYVSEITLLGLEVRGARVSGKELEVRFEEGVVGIGAQGTAAKAVIKMPRVLIAEDWDIELY